MALKWSQPVLGATCLDLCCGSGDLAQMLAQQTGPTGQVYGVDFSSAQLAIAAQRAQKQGLPRIHWIEADVLHLPFADQQIDGVTMGYGLRNVSDISACLVEIQRVLKPGGKAAILDFHRPQHPGFRMFQTWYLEHIVVPTAAKFNLTQEYAYLGPSLDRFPQGSEQVNLAFKAGFGKAVHYPIAGGMMGILVVTKAAA